MSSPFMVSLRCRAVGQTPIYDQLRGERINADVPPSTVESDRFVPSGKHRLCAEASSSAAMEGRPVRPGPAGVSGNELGVSRRVDPSPAVAAHAAVPAVPRHAGRRSRHEAVTEVYTGEQITVPLPAPIAGEEGMR
jgi:hypothetical protein